MSLKTMPEHVRHRLTMHITNVFCLWIAPFYKPARHNMMQLLLCSSVCCQKKNKVSHFGLFISFMKTFSTPDPWLPSYAFRQRVALTSGLLDTAHSGAVLLGRKIT